MSHALHWTVYTVNNTTIFSLPVYVSRWTVYTVNNTTMTIFSSPVYVSNCTVQYCILNESTVLVDTIILTSVSLPGSQRQFRDFQSVAMGPRDVRPNLQRNFHSNVTEKMSYFSDDNWCSELYQSRWVWPKTLPVDINILVHHQKWREKKNSKKGC